MQIENDSDKKSYLRIEHNHGKIPNDNREGNNSNHKMQSGRITGLQSGRITGMQSARITGRLYPSLWLSSSTDILPFESASHMLASSRAHSALREVSICCSPSATTLNVRSYRSALISNKSNSPCGVLKNFCSCSAVRPCNVLTLLNCSSASDDLVWIYSGLWIKLRNLEEAQ